MQIIQKFEQSIIYVALAALWALSVFSADVTVNENAITELTIIVIAVLAGSANFVAVLRWFAINRDLGADAQYWLDRFENETGYDVPDFLENVIVEVVNDADKELETTPASAELAKG